MAIASADEVNTHDADYIVAADDDNWANFVVSERGNSADGR
jgi:hypothetical protein